MNLKHIIWYAICIYVTTLNCTIALCIHISSSTCSSAHWNEYYDSPRCSIQMHGALRAPFTPAGREKSAHASSQCIFHSNTAWRVPYVPYALARTKHRGTRCRGGRLTVFLSFHTIRAVVDMQEHHPSALAMLTERKSKHIQH